MASAKKARRVRYYPCKECAWNAQVPCPEHTDQARESRRLCAQELLRSLVASVAALGYEIHIEEADGVERFVTAKRWRLKPIEPD